MNKTYVFFADGFEEIEAIGTVDILRRAGMDVTTVSVKDTHEVTGAHNVTIKADALLQDVTLDNAEWLILPGGMPGAENLNNCQPLQELLKAQNAKKGKIAAICASPAVVLGQLGLIEGKRATCYPGFEKLCTGAKMEDARCVTEDNIVTANGPSSVTNMCYAIITISKGKQTANEVMTGMLIYPKQQPYYF